MWVISSKWHFVWTYYTCWIIFQVLNTKYLWLSYEWLTFTQKLNDSVRHSLHYKTLKLVTKQVINDITIAHTGSA